MTQKILWCAGAVVAIALLICFAVWAGSSPWHGNSGPYGFETLNCSIPSGASSVTYSATVIGGKNTDAASTNIRGLFAKYDGSISSWSETPDTTETGPGQSDYVTVTSTYITGMVPESKLSDFMNDLQGLGVSIESPSYSTTNYEQLVQSCTDEENNIRQTETLIDTYEKALGQSAMDYRYQENQTTTDYYPNNNSNLDDVANQLQTAWSNLQSANDSIATDMQTVNSASISLTIYSAEPPTAWYPTGSQPQPMNNAY